MLVDVICLISDIPGVDNVSVPLTTLSTADDDTSEDIYVTDLQYVQLAELQPIINAI